MSTLELVRHAQASFFADEYDQLSSLGIQQAQALGRHWAHGQRPIDEVYVGPRRRHRDSAGAAADAFRSSGRPFPDPVELHELDEYDLGGIIDRLAPNLALDNREFAELFERQRHGGTPEEQAKSFQRMFEPLLLHWQAAGEIAGVESWPAFRQRVSQGLNTIVSRPGRGRRVVAFTSGGFIGTTVALVLGAPDRTALELNWRIRNMAVTEFVFSSKRVTLDAFNGTVHLTEPRMMTYR